MVRTRQGASSTAAPGAGNHSDDVEEGIESPKVRRKRIPKSSTDTTSTTRRRGRPKKNATAPPSEASRKGQVRKEKDSDDLSSEDDEDMHDKSKTPPKPKGKQGKVAATKKTKPREEEEEDFEDSSSEENLPVKSKKASNPKGKGASEKKITKPRRLSTSESEQESNTTVGESSFEFVAPLPPPSSKETAKTRLPLAQKHHEANVSTVSEEASTSNTSSSSSSSSSSTNATIVRAPPPPTPSSTAGFGSDDKKEIDLFMRQCLDQAQRINANGRRKLYEKFRKMFYKKRTVQIANDWQKYMAQNMWGTSLLFFKAPNHPTVQNALKFIHKVILTAGTIDEKREMDFDHPAHPLYYYILKLFLQSHMDERALVRLRLINIASLILENYRDIEPIGNNLALRKQLSECFLERIKDRHPPVRVAAVSLSKFYFEDDPEIIKRVKYFARFDPSSDVRKAALPTLVNVNAVKTCFFYDFIFDPEVKVRTEAFSCLATRPMANLKPEEASKTLVWGLNREDAAKKIVVDKLIPAWMGQCENDPIKFISLLGIAKKPRIVQIIFDALYKNNFHDTFEAIDRSFLNEDKVIPIEKISVESAMFWVYMIKKFGRERYNQQRLLPDTEFMIEYIKMIIEAIHVEHVKAQEEDRDEDGTLLISLTYFISIVLQMGVEEGNRRNLEVVLGDILLDPVMDEAPLIKCAVDALKKILDSPSFIEKMAEIFQFVFEPEQTIIEGTPNATPRQRSGGCQPLSRGSSRQSQVREGVRPQKGTPGGSMEVDMVPESPQEDEIRPLTEKEIMHIKNKLCDIALHRLHLSEEKRQFVQDLNYLEAHRLQQEIDALSREEKEIKERLTNSRASSMLKSLQVQESRAMNDTSAMEMEVDMFPPSPVRSKAGSVKNNQIGGNVSNATLLGEQEGGDSRVGISRFKILKGIVMMNRFLSCKPKVTPFVRHFYDNYAIEHFTSDSNDSRTRVELLNFLCLVAMIDPEEKRKVMGLLITALENDLDPDVRTAAFKGIVDCLCRYSMKDFITTDHELSPSHGAPDVFNSKDSTPMEMQNMFLKILDSFGIGEMNTPEYQSVKVSGVIKLFTADRVSSEHLLSEILCFWCDTTCQGTKIPYDIGTWLPIYTKISVSNAKLVSKALFLSVKKVISVQERKSNDNGLIGANYLKLVDFVCPYLSSSHLATPNGEFVNVQEELYAQIVQHFVERTKQTSNLNLVLILPKLRVETEQAAGTIVQNIATAIEKLLAMPQTSTVTTFKTALKKAGKKITSQYEEFDEILETALNINQARNNSNSDTDVSDLDPFSDEEEKSKSSKASSSSAVTNGSKSREEHVQDINDALNMDVDVPENINAQDDIDLDSDEEETNLARKRQQEAEEKSKDQFSDSGSD